MSDAVAAEKTIWSRFGSMSLARRLLIGAFLWGLLVLVGGAFALSAAYRAQTLSIVERQLDETLVTLSRAVDWLPDGRVTDDVNEELQRRFPNDPRYETPLSGHYWAIVAITDTQTIGGDIRSASLWDEPVPVPDKLLARALGNPGVTQFSDSPGPGEDKVRVAARTITAEGRATPLLFMAASDRALYDNGARQFQRLLLTAMSILFAGVFAAMLLQIRFSLRPLQRIRADIAAINEGERTRLEDVYPQEVRPLTGELNKLLDHNVKVVERARTHVGNLAHALKTPLAVLQNEASGDSQLDDVVRRQTNAMRQNVDHYLQRARAAARAETLGARTNVAEVADGLARLLNRLFMERGIVVDVHNAEGAIFRGEKQDLEEMLGNLMDNACKWAASEVHVRVETDQGLVIHVDDDGDGLDETERAGALKRGVRLDETTPGTGLGLSIVTELAELNRGTLSLDHAPEGGLRASLRFGL